MKEIYFAVAAFLALIVLVYAAGAENYLPLKAIPVEQITGATLADSTVATTAILNRADRAENNPTVAVSVDFSGAASDTVVVSCLLYASTDNGSTLSFIGIQTSTGFAKSNENRSWWKFR